MIYEKIVVKVSLPIAHCVMFSFVCFQVNKSEICSNNKGDKISVGEDHDVDFCQNNLGKTGGTTILVSSKEENNEAQFSQGITDTSQNKCLDLGEDNSIIEIHQACKNEKKSVKKSCSDDESMVTVDESTLVKFRNNFFEVNFRADPGQLEKTNLDTV